MVIGELVCFEENILLCLGYIEKHQVIKLKGVVYDPESHGVFPAGTLSALKGSENDNSYGRLRQVG
jgi:hypothetical protein